MLLSSWARQQINPKFGRYTFHELIYSSGSREDICRLQLIGCAICTRSVEYIPAESSSETDRSSVIIGGNHPSPLTRSFIVTCTFNSLFRKAYITLIKREPFRKISRFLFCPYFHLYSDSFLSRQNPPSKCLSASRRRRIRSSSQTSLLSG